MIRSKEARPFCTIEISPPKPIKGPTINMIKELIVTNSPIVILPSTAKCPQINILILIQIKGAILVNGVNIASSSATSIFFL